MDAMPTDRAPDRSELVTTLWWLAAFGVIGLFLGLGALYVQRTGVEDPAPVPAVIAPADRTVVGATLEVADPAPRTLDVYEGYGTWVDVFDYDPAYTPGTPVVAADVAEMAELGVRTVYLQAARLDDRTPDGLVDPWRLTEFLLSAHAAGVDVVGWYLPKFGAGPEDLDRLVQMSEFEVLGQRFDGVGVDIEWLRDNDDETRSARLLELSAALRDAVGDDPLGAIVFTPVQMEVVNDQLWPGFPWEALAAYYDVWLPMSYWSFRSESSGYADGYTYHEESVRRLRSNVGDPDALVHGIGGIGGLDGVDDPTETEEPLATIDEVERFVDALADSGSIGGSIYDWNTLEPAVRARLAELLG